MVIIDYESEGWRGSQEQEGGPLWFMYFWQTDSKK